MTNTHVMSHHSTSVQDGRKRSTFIMNNVRMTEVSIVVLIRTTPPCMCTLHVFIDLVQYGGYFTGDYPHAQKYIIFNDTIKMLYHSAQ